LGRRYADNIANCINAALSSDFNDMVVLSFDWLNAYNTAHWHSVLEITAKNNSAIRPFINLTHAHSAVTLYLDHPSRPAHMTTAAGLLRGSAREAP
jgi:hypothetical protein